MPYPPIVALEIGTAKVAAVVAEMRDDGHIVVTGLGEQPSTGIRKGEVIDLENAVVCVRSALAMAEENGKVTIRQVHLAVSGGHVQSLVNSGAVPVADESGEITSEDIDQVLEVARAVNLPSERVVLHTISQHFHIDNQEPVVRPEGMEGARLSVDMLVVHGVRSRMNNMVRVVRSVPMDVESVAFSGLCSALAVLAPEQKKSGAIVIDLGGGKTDYLAYAGSVVAAAGSLGVGGDHVTNDIALAFNIPNIQAERLKREKGRAMPDASLGAERVTLPAEVGFPGRAVSLRSLQAVIHARLDEVLRMIRAQLDVQGIPHRVGAGVVLTGGGARLAGVCGLAERIFNLPVSVGRPVNVTGQAAVTEGPEYATCCGLAQYGFRHMATEPPSGIGRVIGKIFGLK